MWLLITRVPSLGSKVLRIVRPCQDHLGFRNEQGMASRLATILT